MIYALLVPEWKQKGILCSTDKMYFAYTMVSVLLAYQLQNNQLSGKPFTAASAARSSDIRLLLVREFAVLTVHRECLFTQSLWLLGAIDGKSGRWD
jgi:hypothetical protein